jgi:hypothetical protein
MQKTEKSQETKQKPWLRWHPEMVRGRLPDKTSIHVSYDAAKIEWSGFMLLADGRQFSATAKALFFLLKILDDKFRETL